MDNFSSDGDNAGVNLKELKGRGAHIVNDQRLIIAYR